MRTWKGCAEAAWALGLPSPLGAVGNKGHRDHGSWAEGKGAAAESGEGPTPSQAETDTPRSPRNTAGRITQCRPGDRKELPGRGVNSCGLSDEATEPVAGTRAKITGQTTGP